MIEDRRALHIDRLRKEQFDVLIVGGGINGAGIARDLAMRDETIRVALVDRAHFAGGTSGRNSQLIHGGLRYLKYLDIHLVKEALAERATLLRIARPLVEPLEFLLPCYRPTDRWFFGAGLALYDMLAGSQNIHAHRALTSLEARTLEPALEADGLKAALSFYDCKVHSARLCLENVLDAEARGAAIANYLSVAREGAGIVATDHLTGETFPIRAKFIVESTGAWSTGAPLRLVRGSHLVFPRIQKGQEAISYFDDDGRIVFFIPWGEDNNLTLVGTTDVDHTTGPNNVHISAEETTYLTSIVHRLFPSYREEPVASYSSLRPLIQKSGRSATSTSREHKIWRSPDGILHVSGGKYTTYRAMSEEAVDALLPDLRPGKPLPCQTALVPLSIPATPTSTSERVRKAVDREFARKLPDLLYVSTYWGHEGRLSEDWLLPLAREMGELLGWDEQRVQQEVANL